MSRLVKVLIGILIILVLVALGMAFGFSYPVTQAEIAQRFITANPLDMSTIVSFTQYRSCVGHDYRHPTVATGSREATPRSMKHYVRVKPHYRGTIDQVAVFAPFDGEVSNIDNDLGGPGDQQIWIMPNADNPASPRQWQFVFFHINLDPSLREGSSVTAGQKIGFANLARGSQRATDNFDIAMKFTRPMHQPSVDEVFTHMAPDVLAEYAARGVTPESLVIVEEYRDAHDCPLLSKESNLQDPQKDPDTIYFPSEAGSGESVMLK